MKLNGLWVPCVRISAYSSMPISLKLYMCFEHGLKMCKWFGYNLRITFCYFVSQFDLSHFFFRAFKCMDRVYLVCATPPIELSHFFGHCREWKEGTLCVQLLLQFNTDTFEAVQTL